MCGRYSFVFEDALILERFGIRVTTAVYKARYNCAPTQILPVITNEKPGTLEHFRWGLIPFWAKDASIGNKLINARAETITEKPSFKHAFRSRRCLVPATGFYEWKKEWDTRRDKARLVSTTPYNIRMKTGEPFCFAGLWDQWVSPDGEIIRSFTIITTTPNELVAPIHDRMPVILHQADEHRWIDPRPDTGLTELLQPFPADKMAAIPADKL
jgi:putative SOS response-associated peptidase YedK